MKRILLCALAGGLALAAAAADSAASFVFVNPRTSSFWRTVRSRTFDLPIGYPEGATEATLAVTGVGYSQTYPGITASSYELTLPEATGPTTENTYTLTLTFDHGEPQSTQVSVIAGLLDGGTGSTRCISPDVAAWTRCDSPRVTLPVPYGTTSLTLNGEPVATGLDGAQGFYTVPRLPADLVLTVDEQDYAVRLVMAPGCLLIFR